MFRHLRRILRSANVGYLMARLRFQSDRGLHGGACLVLHGTLIQLAHRNRAPPHPWKQVKSELGRVRAGTRAFAAPCSDRNFQGETGALLSVFWGFSLRTRGADANFYPPPVGVVGGSAAFFADDYTSLREVETCSPTPHYSATACRACSRWPRADERGVQWFVCCIVCGVPLCPLVSSVSR